MTYQSMTWIRAGLASVALVLTMAAGPSGAVVRGPAEACSPTPLTEVERRLIFDAIQHGDEATEAPSTAFDDPTMMATLQRFAVLVLGLRVRPSAIDPLWAIEAPRRNVAAEFEAARAAGRLAAWLRALEPPHETYRQLAAERCRYIAIVDRGGWTPLARGPALKAGDASPAIEGLRVRLGLEGYDLKLTPTLSRFDDDLDAALRAFQRRHDLEEDGVLGEATRAALNVSAQQRLQQIEANLERWRWMPHELPADRLEVDTGAAEATLFLAGRPDLRMRAIVGDPRHRTPMFASNLEAVVFNPPWNVPTSIAQNEILPRLARDPGYLARNGFVRTAQGLQQRPGPSNALGQLKFDLRSPFGVYLHDTPGRAAFARRVRTLSHGCMRLEQPRELAERLLASQGWDRAGIDATIAAGATRRIALQRQLPLFVVYRTASVDAEGWVTFRTDPYGWDSKLTAALAKASVRAPEPRRETECAVSARAVLD